MEFLSLFHALIHNQSNAINVRQFSHFPQFKLEPFPSFIVILRKILGLSKVHYETCSNKRTLRKDKGKVLQLNNRDA